MTYLNNQILKILNESPSYEDIANIYKVSEDILKKANDAGLTFATSPDDKHYSYMINQFRDLIGQQLKSGKPVATNILAPFFKETMAVNKGTVDLNYLSDDHIDRLQAARRFLDTSRNEIIKARGLFRNSIQQFQPMISRFGLRYNP